MVWLPFLIFPYNWVSNHPNWRTHIFQRGGPTTNQAPHPASPRVGGGGVPGPAWWREKRWKHDRTMMIRCCLKIFEWYLKIFEDIWMIFEDIWMIFGWYLEIFEDIWTCNFMKMGGNPLRFLMINHKYGISIRLLYEERYIHRCFPTCQ